MMENIKIRPLAETDWETLSELFDRRFGEGYLEYNDFVFKTTYPEFNLVADDGGRAVALVSMMPMEPHALAEATQMDEAKLIADAAGRKTLYSATVICDERHEGNGVTRKLAEQVIANAKELGYGVIVGLTWKYDGKVPAGKLAAGLGFKVLGEKHEPWLKQEGYTCIICKGPCHCDADLVELVL